MRWYEEFYLIRFEEFSTWLWCGHLAATVEQMLSEDVVVGVRPHVAILAPDVRVVSTLEALPPRRRTTTRRVPTLFLLVIHFTFSDKATL
jgi:hypothetical protein